MSDDFLDRVQDAIGAGYVIERELPGGGMSRVFVATERALGRTVVVKVLPPDLAAGVNRERFQREIHLAAALQHPHIVPLLSAGESAEVLYYTMPFIDGESLREAVARRGGLPVREVVRVLHDVGDALAYAHERGVIHRDIKPGNVLLSRGHALVTDFGVAKALSAALPHSGTTSAGIAIGTPAYMAPEQLAADPAADHRMDLYALGLLAYELLTGQSPFTGESPQATMAAQLTRVPDPLHQVRPDVPREISDVIMRCLEKLPDRRPRSAQALVDELEGVSTPHGAVVSAPRTLASPERRRRRIAAFGAVAATAIAAAAFATVYGGDERPGAVLDARGDTSNSTVVLDLDTTRRTPEAAAVPPAASTARPVLTRADSLAIAEAVRKGLEKSAAAAPGSEAGAASPAARRSRPATVAGAAPSSPRPGDGVAGVAGAAGATAAAAIAAAGLGAGRGAVVVKLDSLTVHQEKLADSIVRAVLRERGRYQMSIDPREIVRLRELARHDMVVKKGTEPQAPAAPRATPQVRVMPPAPPVAAPAVTPSVTPAPPGVRRVLIADPNNATGNRELDSLGPIIGARIREAIRASGRYEVADDPRMVQRMGSRARTNLARSLGAGAVVVGLFYYQRSHPDSFTVQIQIEDLRRGYVVKAVQSKPVAVEDATSGVAALAEKVAESLAEVAWRQ